MEALIFILRAGMGRAMKGNVAFKMCTYTQTLICTQYTGMYADEVHTYMCTYTHNLYVWLYLMSYKTTLVFGKLNLFCKMSAHIILNRGYEYHLIEEKTMYLDFFKT